MELVFNSVKLHENTFRPTLLTKLVTADSVDTFIHCLNNLSRHWDLQILFYICPSYDIFISFIGSLDYFSLIWSLYKHAEFYGSAPSVFIPVTTVFALLIPHGKSFSFSAFSPTMY